MSPQPQLILLFGTLISLNTVNANSRNLVYNVKHTGSQIEISVQFANTQIGDNQHIPDLSSLGASPLIRLSTCAPSTPSPISGLLPIAHTLLTTARLTPSQLTGRLTASFSVPSYLDGIECLEVSVKESIRGAGLIVPPLRKEIRNLSAGADERNSSEIFCYTGDCEVLDSCWIGSRAVGLVHHTTSGGYSLVHHTFTWTENSSVVWHLLPACITAATGSGHVTWQRVETNMSCQEAFIPTHIHPVSKNDIFVRGNGLLYSPNGGLHLHQLMAPNITTERVLSFAVSTVARVFAMATSQSISPAVWFGYVGDSVLHQLHPSSLLDHLLQSWGVELNFTDVSLIFDNSGSLCLVMNSTTVKLPLALLLSHTHTGRSYAPTAAAIHPLLHLHHLHTLTHSTSQCPYQEARIEAPVCGQLTRTRHHVQREGALRWISNSSSAETNCSKMGDYVPRQIFMNKLESYQFKAHFLIDPTIFDPTKLLFTALVSDPDMVQVTISSDYSSLGNTVTFTAVVKERGQLTGQREPGAVATSSALTMKLWGAKTNCLDTTSSTPLTPDHIQTMVHVGCPPGISMTFDPETTRSQLSQHCQGTANVSCYYFNNVFQPVFKLMDSVTNQEVTYLGPYTLKALSGGVSLAEMREFESSQRVESSIWTPMNSSKNVPTPVYYYGDNAISWVCGTSSPCGEIIPKKSQTTEYYLLLEASNLLDTESSTYCQLSVRFLIRIHGLGMGAGTTVISLTVFTAALLLLILALFLCWLNRLKLKYWRDLLKERQGQRWAHAKLRMTELMRRHRLHSHKNRAFM